ncbi:MAG: leucyl aminopeptidase, partial [Lachnospiraceae bacterium]|nr:leucyl aminopeptidase [Lachnospiraceae bacterium]
IIAKDNEVSVLRDTDVSKAYFQCHTDVTIPYDELGEVSVLTGSGEKIIIIQNGQFVLPGCEELNRALEETE